MNKRKMNVFYYGFPGDFGLGFTLKFNPEGFVIERELMFSIHFFWFRFSWLRSKKETPQFAL